MIKRLAQNQNWAKATPWMGIISAILLFAFYSPSQAMFWINIGLVCIAFTIFSILSFYNIGFGMLIIIFSIINCLTHIFQGFTRREWNPGLIVASMQFLLSLYGAYFITINALTNQWLWWSCSVIFTVVVHALLFRKILKD